MNCTLGRATSLACIWSRVEVYSQCDVYSHSTFTRTYLSCDTIASGRSGLRPIKVKLHGLHYQYIELHEMQRSLMQKCRGARISGTITGRRSDLPVRVHTTKCNASAPEAAPRPPMFTEAEYLLQRQSEERSEWASSVRLVEKTMINHS